MRRDAMTPHALPSVRARGEARGAQEEHAPTVMPSPPRGHAIPRASVRVIAPCGHPGHAMARKEGAMLIEHVLYQAQVKATGGREGRAVSSDGVLEVQLTTPRALGGAGRRGTNPEQLFAAGYA